MVRGTSLKNEIDIERLFVDVEVSEHPRTKEILGQLSKIPFEILTQQEVIHKASSLTVSQGKRNLWISQFRGPFLKPCPGTKAPYLCCNYWILNLQSNCPSDCSYCVLQNYLNFPMLTLYVNLDRIPDEIEALQKRYPKRLLRIGTGELTDSLVLDPLTRWNSQLIRVVSGRPVLLELKTKSANMEHLPVLEHRNVVVSCSMNPPGLIQAEEHKTASFEDRLGALRDVAQNKGYRLGIHLDPVIEIQDWQVRYEETIQRITETLNEEDVAWISLGALRFPRGLKQMAEERFTKTRIFLGEFIPCPDGKMRYFRPIRTEIYRKIYSKIQEKWKKVFIYFCMEHPVVWENIMSIRPINNDHVDFLFHQNIAKRFPDLNLSAPQPDDYAIG